MDSNATKQLFKFMSIINNHKMNDKNKKIWIMNKMREEMKKKDFEKIEKDTVKLINYAGVYANDYYKVKLPQLKFRGILTLLKNLICSNILNTAKKFNPLKLFVNPFK